MEFGFELTEKIFEIMHGRRRKYDGGCLNSKFILGELKTKEIT